MGEYSVSFRRNHLGYRVGESHHRAKLSDDIVAHMRHLRQRYGWTFSRIGQEVGCSKWTARDICEYRTRAA